MQIWKEIPEYEIERTYTVTIPIESTYPSYICCHNETGAFTGQYMLPGVLTINSFMTMTEGLDDIEIEIILGGNLYQEEEDFEYAGYGEEDVLIYFDHLGNEWCWLHAERREYLPEHWAREWVLDTIHKYAPEIDSGSFGEWLKKRGTE